MNQKEIKIILRKAKKSKCRFERSRLQLELLNGDHYKTEIEGAFVDCIRGSAPLNAVSQYIESLNSLPEAQASQ